VIAMPCVSPDGKPTPSGMATLEAVKGGASTPKEISDVTGQPLFRVRSGLRELVGVGFLEMSEDRYLLTSEGKNVL
jgi:DNA-binding IclR family transcriptional regulator